MNTVNKQHVQLPRTLDATQLAQLQAQARQRQLEGFYTGHSWVYPCAEKQSFHSFQQALEVTQEMTEAGRALYPHDFPEHSGLYYAASFWRTPEEIEAILQASDIEVEAAYKASIEEFNQAQVELLTQQLVEQELNKERKKEDDRLAAIQAKAAATAAKHIQSQLTEGK